MRPYEVLVIFSPTVEDTAVNAVLDRATDLIRKADGVVGAVDRWGRRRLAYEIQHHREGYYVLVEATTTPEVIAEVDRVFMLADEVIRHKVIRVPDVVIAGRASPSPRAAATAAVPVSTPGGNEGE